MSTRTGKAKAEAPMPPEPESDEPLAIVARRIAQSNPAAAEKLQAISDARVKGN